MPRRDLVLAEIPGRTARQCERKNYRPRENFLRPPVSGVTADLGAPDLERSVASLRFAHTRALWRRNRSRSPQKRRGRLLRRGELQQGE